MDETLAKLEEFPRGKRFLREQEELDAVIATFIAGVHYSRGRNNKLVLLQPGAQRIAQYYGWSMRCGIDQEQTAIPGDTSYPAPANGLIVARVDLEEYVPDKDSTSYTHSRSVADGVGAAHIIEWADQGMLAWNVARKMALKRAYVCAVIYAAGLSERFTQDVPPDQDETVAPPTEAPVPEGRVYGARRA